MIAVRDFTNGADVLAHAAEIRRKFYGPRQVAPARVLPAPEKAAAEPVVAPSTPDAQMGSRGTPGEISKEVDPATLLANFKRLTLDRIYGLADADVFRAPTLAEIREEIMQEFKLSRLEIMAERRAAKIVIPRQGAMYLMCKLTTHSTSAIGRFFGGKDHTTVMHARDKTEERLASDEGFAERLAAVEARLSCKVAQ